MMKLTVLVIANNVNGGELNNLAIECDPTNIDALLGKAMVSYFNAVTDEHDGVGVAERWVFDDCAIVGVIDGHPVTVTGTGINTAQLSAFFGYAKRGAEL